MTKFYDLNSSGSGSSNFPTHNQEISPVSPQLGDTWFIPSSNIIWNRTEITSQLGTKDCWISEFKEAQGDLLENFSTSQVKAMRSIRALSISGSNANLLIHRFGINHYMPTSATGTWTATIEIQNQTTTELISSSSIAIGGTLTNWRSSSVSVGYEIDSSTLINGTLMIRLAKSGTPSNLTFIPWITYRRILNG